ncbi:MAG: DUF3568 family protein [Planctomycetota bacterium]|nr:DUF3568 family protein [Planctomycetota bacterium]MDE1889080.1 DUF3568 family protein [Planctomycetota bacterium]MDE2216495.1 DUF3568 family protein [Planctomycetota bacterium]
MAKNSLSIMLLGILLFLSCGCAGLLVGGGAGAGTVAYIKGELKSTEEASIDRTWEAAQEAVKDLEFVITSKEKENTSSAKLIARDARDKKIEIELKKVSEHLTKVTIRVGVFGDESLSRLILERLKKSLGKGKK